MFIMINDVCGFSILDFLCPLDPNDVKPIVCSCGVGFTHKFDITEPDEYDSNKCDTCLRVFRITKCQKNKSKKFPILGFTARI